MFVVLIMIFNDVGVHGKCPPGKQWNPMAKKCIKYYFGSYIYNYKKGEARLLKIMTTNFEVNPDKRHRNIKIK
uniref:Seminal fluid protein n=1 Tax=Drosophila melanogaster TaxID=7227 RepID=A0A0B4KG18_DROME|nr:uncharacterized protein Dmel_CG43829 [Drosophila melanogaster]AGB93521.1 uncharacterized protein Dmel_CG43829 [Drosophila melanogaster]|eukprot:NP_001260989.1 uncharacterized protein Dmel_CG43829 [Drosophila melanogaster]